MQWLPKGCLFILPQLPLAGHGVGRDASGSFGTTSRWQGVGHVGAGLPGGIEGGSGNSAPVRFVFGGNEYFCH